MPQNLHRNIKHTSESPLVRFNIIFYARPVNSISLIGKAHRNHILTRGGILAKCHSTAGDKLKTAKWDKLGGKIHMP